MAAPVVQSKGTAAAVASGTTVSPTQPASIAANDILFLFVNSFTGSSANNTTFSDPSGWTRIAPPTGTAYINQFFQPNGMVGLWWKRAAGGESGTVSVVRGGSTTEVYQGQIYRVSGCVTTGDPWDEVDELLGDASTNIKFDAVTTVDVERTLLILVANCGNTALDVPASYTSLTRDDTTGSSLEALHRANVTTGTYDPADDAGGGNVDGWATVHIALKPAAAGAVKTGAGIIGP